MNILGIFAIFILPALICAIARWMAVPRIAAIIASCIPTALILPTLIAIGPIVRTASGNVLPRWPGFFGGLLFAAGISAVVAALIKTKENNFRFEVRH